jgi:hypothetical protein
MHRLLLFATIYCITTTFIVNFYITMVGYTIIFLFQYNRVSAQEGNLRIMQIGGEGGRDQNEW